MKIQPQKADLFEAIYQAIEAYDTIIIHRHTNPDPDAIGSQAGLKHLIQASFPAKTVYLAGQSSNDLDYLAKMDPVIPDEAFAHALAFVLDCGNQPRISDKRYKTAAKVIKIDHHPDTDHYGDISLVDTTSSSTSELVAEMSLYLKDRLPLNQAAARLLYAGIVGDTGRFKYQSTTAQTHQLVAALLQFDIQADAICFWLDGMPQNVAKIAGYLYQNLTITPEGYAYLVLTQDLMTDFGITDEESQKLVGLPGNIDQVIAWTLFVEMNPGKHYRCRMRSKGPHIQQVALKHDGGGHLLASGANAYSMDEVGVIVDECRQLVQQWLGEPKHNEA